MTPELMIEAIHKEAMRLCESINALEDTIKSLEESIQGLEDSIRQMVLL